MNIKREEIVLKNAIKIKDKLNKRIPDKLKNIMTDEELGCVSVSVANQVMKLSEDFINYIINNMVIEVTNKEITSIFLDMNYAKENISNVEEEAFYNIIDSKILEEE